MKIRSTNRVLSLLLVMLLVFTQIPLMAFAEGDAAIDSVTQEQEISEQNEGKNIGGDVTSGEADETDAPDETDGADATTATPSGLPLGYSGSISGALWLDTFEDAASGAIYGDGIRQLEEQPVIGYSVSLYLEGDTANAAQTTETDADGAYSFSDLEPGGYVVGIAPATVDNIEYLLPMGGVSGDNKFQIDTETWTDAYTDLIEISDDTVVTGMDAGMRTPPGVQAMALGDFEVTGGNLSGTVQYTSLTDAIAAINTDTGGVTYTITANANDTLTSTLQINPTKDVTLKSATGSTYTIQSASNTRHFVINGSLTVENIVLDGGGLRVGYTGLTVQYSGTLTMNSGAVIQNSNICGVLIEKGTFAMNDGEISGNTDTEGAGVRVLADTTFNMHGGKISDNTTTNSGGGGVLVSSNSIFTMTGGEISGNTAATAGGGVCVVSNGIFTMHGGEISGNTAPAGGGGVYVPAAGILSITGAASACEITNNNTAGNGGGIMTGDSTYANITIASSTMFSGNTAAAAYTPPASASILYPNIEFSGTPSYSTHPLNNYDINYTGSTAYYTIAYDANGADSGGAPTDSTLYASGGSVTMPGNTGNLAKSGFAFAGWNTQADGSGTTYAAGSAFTISANTTLYFVYDAESPVIIAPPAGANYTVGDTAAVLTVAASVPTGGALSYQWYSNATASNSGGAAISGETASTYTPPTGAIGTVFYYVEITNTNTGATGSQTAKAVSNAAQIMVGAPASVLTLGAMNNDTATEGVFYSKTFSYTYTGSGGVTFTITGLPSSLSYNPATGGITGTPGSGDVGIHPITVKVEEVGGSLSATGSFTLTVNNAPIPVELTMAVLSNEAVTEGGLYTKTVSVTYTGANALAYSATTTLPAGLFVDSVNGTVSGVPTVPGTYTITVKVEEVGGALTDSQSYTLKVRGIHTLTLTAGTGGSITAGASGQYAEDEEITIEATANAGYTFGGWTASNGGSFVNASGASTTFTMPADDTTVTASFTYTPTLSISALSNDSVTRGNSYTKDISVSVTYVGTGPLTYSATGMPTGVTIDSATGIISGAPTQTGTYNVSVTISDGTATATGSYTLTVNSSSGSSSGGNSRSDSTTYTITIDKQPNLPKVATLTSSGTVANKRLTFTVTKDMVQAAIKEAGTDPDGIALVFNVTGSGFSNQTINFTADAIDLLKSSGVKYVQVQTGIFRFRFDAAAIKTLDSLTTDTVAVTADSVNEPGASKLTGEAAKLIDTRPAFDVKIRYQKSDGTPYMITNLGSGTMTRGIRYTPAGNENTGSLCVVYVDGNGKPEWVNGSSYADGWVNWAGSSCSVYGVGYIASTPAFTDTANHWAKDYIDFAVSRGYMTGTSGTTFAPDSRITRGMFITALGRLADIDVSGYTASSFSDVASDSYFMPYIEWAVANGIVQGTGDGKFSPDSALTREQMAVMIVNYAKATNYTLPVAVEAYAFTDANQISAWSKSAVTAVQQAGIVVGKTDGKFDPKGYLTRAEAATILRRFVETVIDPASARGWVQNESGEWMYYNTVTGKQAADWQTIGGERYYFDADGVMQAGKWIKIDGKWYYFYTNGTLAASTTIDGHEVGEDGARKE